MQPLQKLLPVFRILNQEKVSQSVEKETAVGCSAHEKREADA